MPFTPTGLAQTVSATIVAGIAVAKAFGAPLSDVEESALIAFIAGLIVDVGTVVSFFKTRGSSSTPAKQ